MTGLDVTWAEKKLRGEKIERRSLRIIGGEGLFAAINHEDRQQLRRRGRTRIGADAVMIGRGAQGQPWLPGQIGRRLETGKAEAAPSLAEQLGYVRALYDEVCSHYGLRIGLKHARFELALRARSIGPPGERVGVELALRACSVGPCGSSPGPEGQLNVRPGGSLPLSGGGA